MSELPNLQEPNASNYTGDDWVPVWQPDTPYPLGAFVYDQLSTNRFYVSGSAGLTEVPSPAPTTKTGWVPVWAQYLAYVPGQYVYYRGLYFIAGMETASLGLIQPAPNSGIWYIDGVAPPVTVNSIAVETLIRGRKLANVTYTIISALEGTTVSDTLRVYPQCIGVNRDNPLFAIHVNGDVRSEGGISGAEVRLCQDDIQGMGTANVATVLRADDNANFTLISAGASALFGSLSNVVIGVGSLGNTTTCISVSDQANILQSESLVMRMARPYRRRMFIDSSNSRFDTNDWYDYKSLYDRPNVANRGWVVVEYNGMRYRLSGMNSNGVVTSIQQPALVGSLRGWSNSTFKFPTDADFVVTELDEEYATMDAQDSMGRSVFKATSKGYVGVGKSNPGYVLDVNTEMGCNVSSGFLASFSNANSSLLLAGSNGTCAELRGRSPLNSTILLDIAGSNAVGATSNQGGDYARVLLRNDGVLAVGYGIADIPSNMPQGLSRVRVRDGAAFSGYIQVGTSNSSRPRAGSNLNAYAGGERIILENPATAADFGTCIGVDTDNYWFATSANKSCRWYNGSVEVARMSAVNGAARFAVYGSNALSNTTRPAPNAPMVITSANGVTDVLRNGLLVTNPATASGNPAVICAAATNNNAYLHLRSDAVVSNTWSIGVDYSDSYKLKVVNGDTLSSGTPLITCLRAAGGITMGFGKSSPTAAFDFTSSASILLAQFQKGSVIVEHLDNTNNAIRVKNGSSYVFTVANNGNVTCTSLNSSGGAITTGGGNLVMGTGDITCDQITSGAIGCTSVTASGNVSAASVTASGNVSAASVTASGNVSAASVTASGNVSAASVTASGNVSATTVTATTSVSVASDLIMLKPIYKGTYNRGGVASKNDVVLSANGTDYMFGADKSLYFPDGGVLRVDSVVCTTGVGAISCKSVTASGQVTAGAITCASVTASGEVKASNCISTSDVKLKTRLQPLENSLDKVNLLTGYTYNWKNNTDTKRQVGLIAQEVQDVLPEAVFTSDDTLHLAYGNMAALFVEAIKELSTKIQSIEERLAKSLST